MLKKILEFMKAHKLAAGIGAGIVCVGMFFLILLCMNKNEIVFNVETGTTVEVEYGTQVQLPQITAVYRGSIFHKEGTPLEITTTGTVDSTKIGTYTMHYRAAYKDIEKEISVQVVVEDTQAPVITLVSNPEHFTSPNTVYQEEGFTAIDNYDGDITSNVERIEENGVVIYRVADSFGNETTVEREIVYKDVVAPVITLQGDTKVSLAVGGTYKEPGFFASDDCDGDITANVIVEGTIDAAVAGTYTLLYKVADSSGNVCEVERKVDVKKQTSVPTAENGKIVYLTFDDGPGPYTERLLDILDVYGIKVTFFVTGMNPQYYHLIGEAHRRGHTIALHTFSHQYSTIYSSVEAYYEDLQKIHDIVVEQTGVEPTMVRFPGGTSNSVSKKYCTGIMSQLSGSLIEKGYTYYDWNVSSEDAGSVHSESKVIENVISGISGKNVSVVLQHDIRSFSVEAVDNIIEWGLANGYTFLPMDENTPLVQHKAKN